MNMKIAIDLQQSTRIGSVENYFGSIMVESESILRFVFDDILLNVREGIEKS